MTHTAAYDADALEEPAETGSGGWLREVTVHISMMIVIAALGMALRTSFGFGMLPAIVISLTIYWCLLVVHALVRRGQEAADLSGDVAHLADENAALRRLVGARRGMDAERELPRLAGFTGDRPPPRVMERAAAPEASRQQPPVAPKAALPKTEPTPPAAGKGPREDAKSAPRASDPKTKPPIAPPTAQTAVAPKAMSAAPPARPASAGGPVAQAKKPVPTPAATRPAPPPLPARPRPQGLAALASERPAAMPPVVDAPREMSKAEDPRAQDIAIMQSLIKGLADQINGPSVKAEAKAEVPRAPMAPAPSIPHAPAPVAAATLDTLEEQVGALRDMADDMRDSLVEPAARNVAESALIGVHEELERAIDASRIDLCLDPILDLGDRKARHFEVSIRLRGEDGEIFDPEAYGAALSGTGLRPRIEALTFGETIRLAGEFVARGAYADLFSVASAESLRDLGFHAALSGALAPDATLGARLVMSIAQSEVRAFGPAHWEALAALSDAGLRYALVDVVDLDMDFEGLVGRGFQFVRLDAHVFLQGLAAPHGFVPAADLCRHLSGLGFTLIVSRIAEERELVKVLGFGALLGQGRLFGGPRAIRQDRSATRSSAA
jgi:cyclic-di-GMP phosphodiesterase TipF (flagellum assembly factor)